MRAQAMENLLEQFEDAVDLFENQYDLSMMHKIDYVMTSPDSVKLLLNLRTKSKILRDRSDKSQAVLRELL